MKIWLPPPNSWPLSSTLCAESHDGKFWEEKEHKPTAPRTSSSTSVPVLPVAGTAVLPQQLGPKGSSSHCLTQLLRLCSSPTCCSYPFVDSLLFTFYLLASSTFLLRASAYSIPCLSASVLTLKETVCLCFKDEIWWVPLVSVLFKSPLQGRSKCQGPISWDSL